MASTSRAQRGTSYPLGATVTAGGVNFSVYARGAESLDLLLFEGPDDSRPRVVHLDARHHRTFHYWHALVPEVGAGQLYGFRAHGGHDPARGQRFDGQKVLVDPYARAVVARSWDRAAASRPGDNVATAMKSVVVDPSGYDWEGDAPLERPIADTVIYEMHVKGFTRHPSSGVGENERGTYAGVVAKIPYLQELGVTAVELLPLFQFDEQDAPPGLTNYWGYSPVSFFAPHAGYCCSDAPLAAIDEFRDMVKALHRAGIEVIVDVVYNHTAEGRAHGPTLSFRGLADGSYYILGERGAYEDFTGTGHTVNANHPVVRRMILDSLVYWVSCMHVDGFRFDLASILARDRDGTPMTDPPVLWAIESHPALAGAKIIAEAWDLGLFQVGRFIGDRWHEWNSHFRDDVRRFVRGDAGSVSGFASRLIGSPDLFGHEEREAEQSVNFVTCHDGFTLEDLVSYDRKHNEANGEEGRDGLDENFSWNCGVEGPTDDPAVERLRGRQIRNFLTVLLLSPGTPMLSMGDEVRRSQRGNNNAYCQDDETSWLDWRLLERHRDVHRFVTRLIELRRVLGIPTRDDQSLREMLERAAVRWHGVRLHEPDWSASSHSLACTLRTASGELELHWTINAYTDTLAFALPPASSGRSWRRLIDTSLAPPHDCRDVADAEVVDRPVLDVSPRSIVVLARVLAPGE